MSKDLVLIFPPYWGFDIPYISLPILAGSLRQAGFNVEVRDLNIELAHRLLSDSFLGGCVAIIRQRLMRPDSRSSPEKMHLARELEECLVLADAVLPRIAGAFEILRTELELESVSLARNLINDALRIISAAFHPTILTQFSYLRGSRHVTDLDVALQESAREESNLFFDLMDADFISSILETEPQLIGFSIASQGQLVPALTLARRIRAARPHIPIVVGGALCVVFAHLLPRTRELFDLFDYVLVGEGETALNRLVGAVKENRRPADIAGLYYADDSRVQVPPPGRPEDLATLPTPDYSDLPLNQYFSAHPVLPLLASRGCYWSKCAFCGLNETFYPIYRERPMKMVLDDISAVMGQVGSCHISFNDQAFSASRMALLADGLIERGIRVPWDILARPEKDFTPDRLHKAHVAGLTFVKWGLESASPAVLKRMRKGTRVETVRSVLRSSAAAGIWNHCFVIAGFPGETRKDFLKTLQFLMDEALFIDSISVSPFSCDRGSAVFKNPQRYGVSIAPIPERYFGPEHDFTILEGVSRSDTSRFIIEMDEAFACSNHLSRINKTGLTNMTIFRIVDLFGRSRVRKLLADNADRLRRLFTMNGDSILEHRSYRVAELEIHNLESGDPADGTYGRESLIFGTKTGRWAIVNEMGLQILSLLAQGKTVDAVVRHLASLHLVPPPEVQRDCVAFLKGLLIRELVIVESGGIAQGGL